MVSGTSTFPSDQARVELEGLRDTLHQVVVFFIGGVETVEKRGCDVRHTIPLVDGDVDNSPLPVDNTMRVPQVSTTPSGRGFSTVVPTPFPQLLLRVVHSERGVSVSDVVGHDPYEDRGVRLWGGRGRSG
jgi:hypothetical protein